MSLEPPASVHPDGSGAVEGLPGKSHSHGGWGRGESCLVATGTLGEMQPLPERAQAPNQKKRRSGLGKHWLLPFIL